MFKKLLLMMLACLTALVFAGTGLAESDRPLQVVCTTFPQYDWARAILGEKDSGVELTLLLDSGVDLHSYQPTAADIARISTCDLFIYVGGESDEWVEDVLAAAQTPSLHALSLLSCVEAREEETVEGMQESDHYHDTAFTLEDIQNRTLEDFGGKWVSLWPMLKAGQLDAFLRHKAGESDDPAVTVDSVREKYIAVWACDAVAITVEGDTISFDDGDGQPLRVSEYALSLIHIYDLRDLEMLLEQTQGTGVDVYAHSEMLPAHYYPAFKKYPNFIGNYGNAWWKQKEEFESFNGPILMTTNCIVPPKDSYKHRLYTTGAAGYPGCTHIPGEIGEKKDFSVMIEHARRCPAPTEIETGELIGGFAHAQVLALADQIVEAVKRGAIRKFVVMAGCDGRAKSREYYTEFAKALPKDAVILTAGCAKYRYNKLDLGDINGIPRVLDAGQCNDSYSLAVIALKLKEVFGLDDINDLPIVYNIAWYEQKAVIVLLALLYLGVKNIHLGPTLPAFLSPNVAKVLVENFGIAGIDSVEEDMKLFFGTTA